MSKDLATAVREVGESLGGQIRASKPTKQEQLAKLIIEIGLDAAQVVFQQTRARLERIT